MEERAHFLPARSVGVNRMRVTLGLGSSVKVARCVSCKRKGIVSCL